MSVISVKRTWKGETAGFGPDRRDAQRQYDVQTNSAEDGAVAVLAADGIPRKGDRHPDDAWRICTGASIAGHPGPCSWIVSATFEAAHDAGTPGMPAPVDVAADFSYGWHAVQEPVDCDANDAPLVNAAGEPFNPPPTEEFLFRSIIISRNEPAPPPDDMNDVLNEDACLGAGPGELWLRHQSVKVHSGGAVYYRTTYTLIRRKAPSFYPADKKGGWWRRVLNQGHRHAAPADEQPTPNAAAAGEPFVYLPNIGVDGKPLSEPQRLDESGFLLDKGQPAHWLYFKRKPWKRFATLGLPEG